jgi:integrase
MASRRRFGRVRRLPSGRFQARYRGPDGVDRPAPSTFATKTDAEKWLARTESEIHDDHWRDPDLGRAGFGEYAAAWIKERAGLRPNTVQLYQYALARLLGPFFGNRAVADIREAHVRCWRGELLNSGASPTTVAKAYRLMKAIMNTAVDEGIVQRNPCRVRGAGQDRSPERPVRSVGEVVALVEVMPERYRALVLLAAFGSLRWGELAALRRCDVDVEQGTVQVERSLTELAGGGYLCGPPKSAAGKRVVVVPAVIRPALADHIATFTASQPDALVFTSPTGALLRDGNFRRRVWRPALVKAGLSGTHFHDLRHTGNTLTATARASLRELMDRMGHSSPRAALIYLHGSDARQRAIADGLSRLVEGELQGRIQGRPKGAPRRDRARGGHASNRGHRDGTSGAGLHAG